MNRRGNAAPVPQEFVAERHHEETIGPRCDPEPLVGDCRVAGSHGIDGQHLAPARLQPPRADLDRIAGMILGNAEENELLDVVPVRFAEFPERAARGVEARSCHVDGTEPAIAA